MNNDVLDVLQRRGFVSQCTDLEGLRSVLSNGKKEGVVFYLGCDPTGASLHMGTLYLFLLLSI